MAATFASDTKGSTSREQVSPGTSQRVLDPKGRSDYHVGLAVLDFLKNSRMKVCLFSCRFLCQALLLTLISDILPDHFEQIAISRR
jgi:hypothetical protein